MNYESNPKHSRPWQRGRKGTLCPTDLDPTPQALLDESTPDPSNPDVRWATDGTHAYVARRTLRDIWHGYPVQFATVPAAVLRAWETAGRVTRRAINQDRRSARRQER
jgi:hypothetical protein